MQYGSHFNHKPTLYVAFNIFRYNNYAVLVYKIHSVNSVVQFWGFFHLCSRGTL